jgi:predicted porin
MNKKLLTIAVGAALVAGPMMTAQAGEVIVYGMVQAEIAQEDVDVALGGGSGEEFLRSNTWDGGNVSGANGATAPGDVLTLEDNQRGRFGIKASEDLGGGMKASAKIEYDLGDTPTFGTGPTIREANVNLHGGFGTFSIGTLKQPYKYTGGVTYDPFVTTNLEARRNGGMTGGTYGHNGFLSNVIGYNSDKLIPMVKVWAVYSPDEQGPSTNGNEGNGGDSGDYSASVTVGDKAWEAFVATAKNVENTTGTVNDYTATKVGGKVKIGKMFTVLGQYEMTDEDISTTTTNEGKILFLGVHVKVGNTTLVGQVGQGELERNNDPDVQEHTYYTVGAIHNFSKTTRLFGGYTSTSLDNQAFANGVNGDRKAISIGLRKDF